MIFKKDEKNLVISYFFPPYADTGGIVVTKRLIEENTKFDILQNNTNTNKDENLNQLIKNNINLRIILNTPMEKNWEWENIKQFIQEGINYLEDISKDKAYDTIYSRSMPRHTHYLAYEYKKQHPETKWIAEFSDPIIYDIYGKKRVNSPLNDEEYLKSIGEETTTTEYLCELLPYKYADKIIFTNENQREIMINKFPTKNTEIKEKIMEKSIIKQQPTLKKEYYNKIQSKYTLNEKYVNIGYFGLFYGTRNFEDVFYSLETIDKTLQKYFKLHIFTNETEFITKTIKDLKIKENIIINPNIEYLEFLNLTQKFDLLVLTDANTRKYFNKNPYLPSKYADYIGSETDIWGICEKNSILDKSEKIKYKSELGKYNTSKETFEKIILEKLKEKGYKIIEKETKQNTEKDIIEYLQERNMSLTEEIHKSL